MCDARCSGGQGCVSARFMPASTREAFLLALLPVSVCYMPPVYRGVSRGCFLTLPCSRHLHDVLMDFTKGSVDIVVATGNITIIPRLLCAVK